MERNISIAEARQNLPALVHEVERSSVLHLTRRGLPVAVLLSREEYDRLRGVHGRDLWEAIVEFRETHDLSLDPLTDADFDNLRDRNPGRDFEWPE